MSNTNYDVELPITYDPAYKHYIPSYSIAVPSFFQYWSDNAHTELVYSDYGVALSFDEENETSLEYNYRGNYQPMPSTVYTDNARVYNGRGSGFNYGSATSVDIPFSSVYSKVYFRNPNKTLCTFTTSNCHCKVNYGSKAAFDIQWNSTGFAANSNAFFKCSTVQKNIYEQYEWTSANVYYKKSTDQNYTSVSGTISGSWSDVRIDTNIGFQDGYTYDVYIVATADDGSTAQTPVAQFTTTDAQAQAECISPAGVFTQGDVTFVWSHTTAYGSQQYAYDLQYSTNNGSSWTSIESHKITPNTTKAYTLTDAGTYKWRVRTYNSNDVAGEWAEASFINVVPANPPSNLSVNTKGRPTVIWAATSQSAYQIQFLLGNSIAYDSGAVYTSQTSHFVNQYFDDNRSYVVRLRIYNALGEVSEWVETGYQQTPVTDVVFTTMSADGGATITVTNASDFEKLFLLRNNKPIAGFSETYTDKYAVGLVNYSVVGVTDQDQSDIQTSGIRITYPQASIVMLNGQIIPVNKRVDNAFEIQTSNEADVNQAKFIGDGSPTHYASNMRLKTFTVNCFDDQGICEDIIGKVVFYADNFGNGGYCMVRSYSKTDNFIKNGRGVYGNEVSLVLEVTNYDDSIEYPL